MYYSENGISNKKRRVIRVILSGNKMENLLLFMRERCFLYTILQWSSAVHVRVRVRVRVRIRVLVIRCSWWGTRQQLSNAVGVPVLSRA